VHLVVGEEEKLHAPGEAIARAERLIPEVTTLLVRGAGHTLFRERPAKMNSAVIGFLTRLDSAAP
jgi:pimeloyl-ACP methyl ester carboxylesterase